MCKIRYLAYHAERSALKPGIRFQTAFPPQSSERIRRYRAKSSNREGNRDCPLRELRERRAGQRIAGLQALHAVA